MGTRLQFVKSKIRNLSLQYLYRDFAPISSRTLHVTKQLLLIVQKSNPDDQPFIKSVTKTDQPPTTNSHLNIELKKLSSYEYMAWSIYQVDN